METVKRKDLEQKIRRQQKKEEKFLDFAFSSSDEDFGLWVLGHMDDVVIGQHTLQAILAEVYRKELFNNNLKALKRITIDKELS